MKLKNEVKQLEEMLNQLDNIEAPESEFFVKVEDTKENIKTILTVMKLSLEYKSDIRKLIKKSDKLLKNYRKWLDGEEIDRIKNDMNNPPSLGYNPKDVGFNNIIKYADLTKEIVKEVAYELFLKQDEITSLEVKNEIRKLTDTVTKLNYWCTQEIVGDYMREISEDENWYVNNNGTYNVYSLYSN